jgi:hypothetical protein
VEDECKKIGWDTRPITIDDAGDLTDGAYWEPAAEGESALRAQVREWYASL